MCVHRVRTIAWPRSRMCLFTKGRVSPVINGRIEMKGFRVLGAALASSVCAASSFAASTVEFDFRGNAGFGLTPGNEVGLNTSLGSDSPAIGDETGGGIVLDLDTNVLSIEFEFSGLTEGLADVASGIHLHQGQPGLDPFNETGPIVFNLNSFGLGDEVFNDNAPIEFGATSGVVSALINVTDQQSQDLVDGLIYLNIHSQGFLGGELRGNLVTATVVPSPTALGGGLLLIAATLYRRRQQTEERA
ncbi:MAG: CHRD domain-containing protein [Planctomycetota bacterium]